MVQFGAAVRAQQMAGALDHILDQSVQWSLGPRPVRPADRQVPGGAAQSRELAGEVAAAGAAADAAAEAIARHGVGNETSAAEVAIAKVRVGEAAGTGAAIAHQVHGAMGFTYEHSLHHATRRLWAWREEFGNEAHWADPARPHGRGARRRRAVAVRHRRLCEPVREALRS